MDQMYTAKDLKPGQRISIHPASDWFMRGIRFADIKEVRERSNTVLVEHGRIQFVLAIRNVAEIVSESAN